MRHIKRFNTLNEANFNDLTFESDLKNVDVDLSNKPAAWSDDDIEVISGSIKWTLQANANDSGIEWWAVSVDSLTITGEFSSDERSEDFVIPTKSVDAELYNVTSSFYATYVEIDLNKSEDPTDWKAVAYFGNPE